LTQDEAREYFSELHGQSQKTGELSDDELDNVSGGGCHVKLNGKKYTVVTSCHSCSHYCDRGSEPHCSELRKAWMDYSRRGKCGWCHYLEFKGSTGYCEFSGKYE
ncbi:MAG: hypothetical protein K2H89_06930, partial [Oscillospiraceae bacterium]|nr:hypothetical protein [Oscillospiraceae bacterium]